MKTQRRPFPLWQAQVDFLDATTTVRGFVGGIGSGKSKIGAYDLLKRAKNGRHYVVTGPTYKVLRDSTCVSFTEVALHCGVLVKPIGGESVSATIRPFSGGLATVLFRSTEQPDLLRGPNLSGVWMDEASLSVYPAYQNLMGRLREAGELGWLSATFTPKGRSHWTYADVFGCTPPRHDVFLVKARTQDNPFVSADYIRSTASTFTGLLALQELGGEFVSVEGAEWPAEHFPDSMWFDDWPGGNWACRVNALDPSKGKDAKSGDYAAFVDLRVDGEGTLWIEADLVRGLAAEALVDLALDWQRTRPADAFAIETNQFQELLAVFIEQAAARQHILVPIVPIDNRVNKLVRIRRLGPYLYAHRVRFRNTPGTRLLVDQLREFPEAPHDDGPDAAEMAVRVAADLLSGALDMTGDESGTVVVHA